MSKSATKAPRAGIGGEKKRGISTFLLAHSGLIRAFVADLDNEAPRTLPGKVGMDVEDHEGYSAGGGAGAGRGAGGGFMAALSCLDHLSSVGPLACGWTT